MCVGEGGGDARVRARMFVCEFAKCSFLERFAVLLSTTELCQPFLWTMYLKKLYSWYALKTDDRTCARVCTEYHSGLSPSYFE